jgi:hypothetical protein
VGSETEIGLIRQAGHLRQSRQNASIGRGRRIPKREWRPVEQQVSLAETL